MAHQDLDVPISSHKAYNFSIPVDHFHNDSRYEPHSFDTFSNRYWINDEHYKSGGPVILYAAGEVSGDARIETLEHGIVDILARELGGLGVILEHRYYGLSYPVENLETKNMRFLTTDQAMADMAYFAQNIVYPGFEDKNLTASDAPYILWGGSYAGAFVAFARKTYPDIFWGAISSSGVTVVFDDWWQYFEAARLYSPGECAPIHQRMIHLIDNILLGTSSIKKQTLKKTFGLEQLDDVNFGYAVARGIYTFQSVVWEQPSTATRSRSTAAHSCHLLCCTRTRRTLRTWRARLLGGEDTMRMRRRWCSSRTSWGIFRRSLRRSSGSISSQTWWLCWRRRAIIQVTRRFRREC